VSVRSTCKTTCYRPNPFRGAPKEAITFTDHVYYHNISITYDGEYYYTINGGNDAWGVINKYDEKGNSLASYKFELDARSILNSANDGRLYVKGYGTDLYAVNLSDETFEVVLEGVFHDENSSVGISMDGKQLFEHIGGVVRVVDIATGRELRTFTLKDYYDEHGYRNAIAVCKLYCHVWAAENRIIVHELDGTYIATLELPQSGYGFSLSFCNKMLWIAEDADAADYGGEGQWFGYKLK
jgi:hypothetical protein